MKFSAKYSSLQSHYSESNVRLYRLALSWIVVQLNSGYDSDRSEATQAAARSEKLFYVHGKLPLGNPRHSGNHHLGSQAVYVRRRFVSRAFSAVTYIAQ